MNPENPIDPRQALEPSLTALLLGELPDDQARFIRQAIATDPELAKAFERLKQTTALMRETEAHPIEEPAVPPVVPKLSDAKRQELLRAFKTIQPEQFKSPVRRTNSWLVPAAAMVVLTAVLASALLPALSRSKSRSMAEFRSLESLGRRTTATAPANVSPESAAVRLSESLTPSERQRSEQEAFRKRYGLSHTQTPPAADNAFDSIAGKPIKSLSRELQHRSPAQDDKNYGLLQHAETAFTVPSGGPIQQTIVLPAPGKSESWSVSTGTRGFYIESAPPANDAPLLLGEQSHADNTFTYSGGIGGGAGANGSAQPQTPSFGDAAQLGRLFSSQTKDVDSLSLSQGGRNAGDESLKQDGLLSGRPQPPSSVYFGGAFGGYSMIQNGAQPGAQQSAGQLADLEERQSMASFDKPGIEFGTFSTFARAKSLPGLQSELRDGSKPPEAEVAQKLALADSLEKEKASNEPQRSELAGVTGPQVEAKKQAGELPLGISVQGGTAELPASSLKTLNAKGQELDARAAGRGDQQDLGAAKPALQPAVPQPEIQVRENAFSTFSLNVSDVSFKLAGASLEQGKLPDPAGIRVEEFINAFDYRDPEPVSGAPVAFAWDRARYPFTQNRDLLRFSLKTAAAGRQAGRPLNIVLLLDNSGSMERADRVRIIHEALRVLASQLQASDILSVVTFARTARLWVDGVAGDQAGRVADELSGLTPQGGTNLEQAMNLAYQTALRHYQANGINRVVLLTDGAANLGDTDPSVLKQRVEANRKQGIALDCFGIGWEGYNDDLLEVLTRNGDGRYGFLNTPEEAATGFASQLAGALRVAAADVKVQVEFNPNRVTSYRQMGYARHQLTKEQFRDNTVNAAAIGAAESGNALYLIETNPQGDGPIAIVRVRFRTPGTTDYQEQEWTVPYNGNAALLEQATPAMRLAGTAAAFSEWLAASPYAAEITPDRLVGYLAGVSSVYGPDPRPQKLEWMIRQAKAISGK